LFDGFYSQQNVPWFLFGPADLEESAEKWLRRRLAAEGGQRIIGRAPRHLEKRAGQLASNPFAGAAFGVDAVFSYAR